MYTVPYRIPSGQWNANMNRQIVFFHRSLAAEHRMIRALEAGGMKVYTARSPATMHNLFVRKLVSVVVVPHTLAGEYHVRIRLHLLEAKSPVAAVCWMERQDGTIATRTISTGDESMNKALARENHRVAVRVALLLRSSAASCTSQGDEIYETAATYGSPARLPPISGLHRKMRLILERIAASGDTGISPEHIIREIWPDTERDRMRDLQSYVSKLRKTLAEQTVPPLRIVYRNRRYRLSREQ